MDKKAQQQPYFQKDKVKKMKQKVSFQFKTKFFRHFKALMIKNGINWKRTWCGSSLEILCPIILMMFLTLIRSILVATTSPDMDYYTLQTPFYQSALLNATNATNRYWNITPQAIAVIASNLYPFLNYTGYKVGINKVQNTYNPILDFNSPYQFMPPHCYQPLKEYNSPAIGYVFQNNTIEKDMINQMQLLFTSQVNYSKATNFTKYPIGNFTFQRFNTTQQLSDYIKDVNYGLSPSRPALCFGFKIQQNNLTDYELELFFNDLAPNQYTSIPNQKNKGADVTNKVPDMQSFNYYTKYGYNFMTNLAANTIIKNATRKPNASIVAMVMPMQAPPTVSDNFVLLLQFVLPFFLMLIYIPVLYRTVYRIVFEKVTKAKESMRMMGMGDFAYWSSWLAYYTIVNFLIVTTIWIVLLINCFSRSSAAVLWVFLFFYGQSLFGFILIIQSLFSSPRAAAISTTVVYFGTSILSSIVTTANTSRFTKIGVCWFFPTVSMVTGIQPLIITDSTVGLNFRSWSLQYLDFSVRDSVFLFIVGGVQMFVIGLYLEKVMPKTYGQKEHPCFFLLCCFRKQKDILKSASAAYLYQSGDSDDDENTKFETQYLNRDCYESVPQEIQQKEQQNQILKICGLKKVYENGFKAVQGVNLIMYSDQIFVLLGHNGAGKTTTISILTGLFGATEGSVELFGIDMFHDMDQIRATMGVCPQHDVLFELLTVKEHLEFFYDLKGADSNSKKKNAEINKLMQDVGVYDKRNALAYQLSGGNKRKLSVAIALCGGSKFVLLDEPTSGMDLSARRQLWNTLKEQKKGRIIILTTHYMDEADILGDRIGIMASGKLTALGTSIFLKTKFGVGYNLTIVKSNSDPNPALVQYIKKYLGDEVKKQSEIQSEMTIQIPLSCSSKFVQFFQHFDTDLVKLKVQSYGISISTLEEVFLKMGHLDDPTKPLAEENIDNLNTSQALLTDDNEKQREFNMSDNVKELDESFQNNISAVLYKRYSNYKRNKKAIFNETVIPAVLMIIGIFVSRIITNKQSPSTIQDINRLPNPQNLLFNQLPTNLNVTGNKEAIYLSKYLPNMKQFNVTYAEWNMTNAGKTTLVQYGDQVTNLGYTLSKSPPYMYGSYQIFEADNVTQQYKFISFVNLTSQDAAGLYPIFMYESILKIATRNEYFKFKVRTTPYPPTELLRARSASTSNQTVLFVAAISYSMMIVAVVSYLVVERTNGLKHLQLISGMQLSAYWIGNFIFDFFKMQLTIAVTISMFFALKMGFDNASITFVLLPFGILPFTYVTSFIFKTDNAAQTFTMFFHFLILGIVCTVVYFLRFAQNLQQYGDAAHILMRVIPTYTLGSSIYCDTNCNFLAQARLYPGATGKQLDSDVWGKYNITTDLIALGLHLVFWSLIIVLIEKGFFSIFQGTIQAKGDPAAYILDEDVQKEQERINKGNDNDIIQVKNFKKVFSLTTGRCCTGNKPLVAVNNLCFGLSKGECFALLGVNGAGKSTTFKSLTCEVVPTSGQITIAGFNVQSDFEEARKLMGYCPQHNLIFEEMTVEEHLVYYAQVKGIPKDLRNHMIEAAIDDLGLGMHRHKASGTLSGGNKRKLCVALAMLGNPPIIFLDEPSAGMDPESRRFMWSVVGKIAQKKTSAVVLTSHSMEEAEALSTKMGIMVKGGIFKCFGSAQHIKNKFGTGYVIEIKIKNLDEVEAQEFGQKLMQEGLVNFGGLNFSQKVQDVIVKAAASLESIQQYRQIHGDINLYQAVRAFCKTFDQVDVLEKYGAYMRVRVARLDKSIGFVFGLVEKIKQDFDISEYSVSQTTLEQIFQSFADLSFIENVQSFKLQPQIDGQSELVIVDQAADI